MRDRGVRRGAGPDLPRGRPERRRRRPLLLGTRHRTSPDLAAFANGAAIRHYDLNDVYVGRSSACHPSDHIAACLAVAEAERSSPVDLVTSIALAYEVNCRLMDAFDLSARGWDDATVFSLPAVALAAGKLMIHALGAGEGIGLLLDVGHLLAQVAHYLLRRSHKDGLELRRQPSPPTNLRESTIRPKRGPFQSPRERA
jgi:hypothetical protein